MGKRLSSLVLVLLCLFGVFSGVYAEQPAQQQVKAATAPDLKSYFVLKAGVFYPQGDLKDLNTGFNGEIAYGYRFHENMALELGSGYLTAGNTYRTAIDGTGLALKERVYAIPLTLTFKGIMPVGNGFEVYGLAGGGGYYIRNHSTFTIADVGRVSTTDHSLSYGGFLGAGATYDMTREWFVGLEGKYLVTDRPKLTTNLGGEALSANFRLQGITGAANIGYRF
jgi:outer membrane protein W